MEKSTMESAVKEFLPIGSTVIVRGSVKKLMIIARAVFAQTEKGEDYFDYGACTYPEGVLGENLLYFQGQDIVEVVAKGYTDEDDGRMIENIRTGLEKMEHEKEQKAER